PPADSPDPAHLKEWYRSAGRHMLLDGLCWPNAAHSPPAPDKGHPRNSREQIERIGFPSILEKKNEPFPRFVPVHRSGTVNLRQRFDASAHQSRSARSYLLRRKSQIFSPVNCPNSREAPLQRLSLFDTGGVPTIS